MYFFICFTFSSFIIFYLFLSHLYHRFTRNTYLKNSVTQLFIHFNLIISFSEKYYYNSYHWQQRPLSLYISFHVPSTYLKMADLDSQNICSV
jgi:hypothetical protein